MYALTSSSIGITALQWIGMRYYNDNRISTSEISYFTPLSLFPPLLLFHSHKFSPTISNKFLPCSMYARNFIPRLFLQSFNFEPPSSSNVIISCMQCFFMQFFCSFVHFFSIVSIHSSSFSPRHIIDWFLFRCSVTFLRWMIYRAFVKNSTFARGKYSKNVYFYYYI